MTTSEGTTNTIYINDVLSGPAAYIARSTNYTYGTASVATTYQSSEIKCSNSTSTALFAQLLMDKVFKIENSGVYTNFAESYAQSTSKSTSTEGTITTNYIKLANIGTTESSDYTHLAGTILSFKCNYEGNSAKNSTASSFNVAIFLEEVYDSSTDHKLVNKIDIDFREEEPFLQTILSTSGNARRFKKGVKLSDFSKFIEQWKGTGENATPNGYVRYHSMEPTNMSIGVNTHTKTGSANFSVNYENMYTTTTTKPTDVQSTYFTGYIVIGGFNKKPGTDDNTVDKLIECRPYLTIIHVDKLAKIDTTFTSINNSLNLMFIKLSEDSILTVKENIPSNSVFEKVFTEEFVSTSDPQSATDLNSESEANFYVLKVLEQ